MNKKDECDIVKDLSSLHIENMLSQNSKKFVDNHLKECDGCKKYYNDLNSNFLEEEKKEKKNDEVEINHLKKVNKKMITLKWTIAAILWFIIILIFAMYFKIYYINEITSKTSLKMRDMKYSSTNYKLEHKTLYKSKGTNKTEIYEKTYYYKDNMNKEVYCYYQDGVKIDEKIRFIKDYSYEKITVFPMLKQIDYQVQDFIEVRMGDNLNQIVQKTLLSNPGINNLGVYVKTEIFDEKECWVIKDKSKVGYRDIYIEKATGNLIRIVEDYYSYYQEELFILTEGTVTDEDVDTSILNTEEYQDYKRVQIDYKLDEDMRNAYEVIDKRYY